MAGKSTCTSRRHRLIDGSARLNLIAGKGFFDCFAGLFNSPAGRFACMLHSMFSGFRAPLNSPGGCFAGTRHSPFSGFRTSLNSLARGLPGALDLSRGRTMRGSRCGSFWSRLVRCCLLRKRDGRKDPHYTKRNKKQENLFSNRSNHCCNSHGFPLSCKPRLCGNLDHRCLK